MRLVNGVPLELFYVSPGFPGFMLNTWKATEVRAELEARAKGPMGQNLDHLYSLSPADEAYVDGLLAAAGLGVSASSLLAQMDGWRIPARPSARNYVEQHGGLTGNIKRPVLSIHTTIDPLVPVSEEYVYRETVHAAGQG
ncbi:MAG: hypothetical protein V1755_04840, partial [Chloroflexota bacterium]